MMTTFPNRQISIREISRKLSIPSSLFDYWQIRHNLPLTERNGERYVTKTAMIQFLADRLKRRSASGAWRKMLADFLNHFNQN